MDIREMEIDEQVSEFLQNTLKQYKEKLEEQAREAIKRAIDENREAYFKFVDEAITNAREEFSARLAEQIAEYEEHIAELEESTDAFKAALTERANAFLANAKDEIRVVVEENASVSSETLQAQRVLDEIRSLIGVQTQNVQESTGELERLKEDIEALKERVQSKNAKVRKLEEANEKLTTQLHVKSLLESVPSGDRDIFETELSGARNIQEADERFKRAERLAQSRRKTLAEAAKPRGVDKEPVDMVSEEVADPAIDRMKKLAGIS